MRRAACLALALVLTALAAAAQPAASPAAPLWNSGNTLELTIKAPFGELFRNGRNDTDFAVPAVVEVGEAVIQNAKLTTRGHSSLRETECEFPKLKLVLDGAGSRDRPPFAGMSAVKIGTHCGEGPDRAGGKYGRWPNQRAAHREALVYRLLDALAIPTLKARPARITYVQTDAPNGAARAFTRDAFLLEDDDEAMKRFGATAELPERPFGSAPSVFAMADIAKVTFGQALIGNFDWCLRMHPLDTYRCNDTTPIWNVNGFVRPDGTAVPVMADFDLSGIVTLGHPWFKKVFTHAFADSPAAVEVLAQVQRTRSLFPRDLLDATRRALIERKAAAYAALAASPIDPDGRRAARAYMDAFFEAIATDEAFYRPVIVTSTRAFLDARRTRPACDTAAAVGTPVLAKHTEGELSQVVVLDALWHWSEKCEPTRLNPIWVPTAAISRDYPAQ
jgi:hypothetical protein